MNKLTWILIAIILILIAVLVFWKGCDKEQEPGQTVYVHDTTVQVRYERSVDTVKIPFYKKIYLKEVKADTIKYQTVDTVFIEQQKDKDLILGFEKTGTDLKIWALNINGRLLKEQMFTNVYGNFSAYSATNSVVVKSSLWYWNGINASYTHVRPVSDLKLYRHNVDLTTGVNFINRYSLDAGMEYDIGNKELGLKGRVSARLF